jgi:hypothetical protein
MEEKARGKELASFCGMLIEDNEDAVVEAIQSDTFAEGE